MCILKFSRSERQSCEVQEPCLGSTWLCPGVHRDLPHGLKAKGSPPWASGGLM